MSGEKIVRALDAIPDDQLQSAMSVYDRRKKLKYIWLRTAIALILLAAVIWYLVTATTSVAEEPSSPECALAPANTVVEIQKGTVDVTVPFAI